MIIVENRDRRDWPRRIEPTGGACPFVRRRLWFFAFVAVIAGLTGTTVGPARAETEGKRPAESEQGAPKAADAVDCLLPGQIRPLGRQATYLARGQTIRTTPLHCAQRGGQIVSEGQKEPAQK
jgi:hypothetical protein